MQETYLSVDVLLAFVHLVPTVLRKHISESVSNGRKNLKQSALVRQFCDRAVEFLEDPDGLPEEVLRELLRSMPSSLAIFKDYPLLRKRLLLALASIWSTSPSESMRVVALLALHGICSKNSKLASIALKVMYRRYKSSCSTLSAHNLGQAGLLLNGLVEIFSVCPERATSVGTRSLRQMALLLQQATKRPSKENLKKVLCWQFVSCIRFWARLLISRPQKSSDIVKKTLLFPFASLLTCLLAFQFTPRLFGFHFHCIAVAIELNVHCGVKIPIASSLLKIVAHVAKQPLHKLETKKACYDLVALYKVSKSEINTKGYLVRPAPSPSPPHSRLGVRCRRGALLSDAADEQE